MGVVQALFDTINPKGGNGVRETFIFVFLVCVLVFLSYNNIPVSDELKYVIYAVLGYVVGGNRPKKDKDISKKEGVQ
jgi:hypothetical protein